jgi:hypothetical protein
MHGILVRPPPPFALGTAAIAGGKAEVLPRQGTTLLLVLATPVDVVERKHAGSGSVASWRPREWSPRVDVTVHLSSGAADDRGSSGRGSGAGA